MTTRSPITDCDIQAYVDGELSAERQTEVEAHLLAHPEAAFVAEEYQQMNRALRQLYDPVLEEPVPPQLALPPPRRRLWAIAAAIGWLSIGSIIGWGAQSARVVQLAEAPHQWDLLEPNLVRPAAFAHTVYTPEIRHPVEVSAGDEQHLVSWLSKRLHADISAPDLTSQGYRLVGGRLLPSTNRMAAQFMYERNDGQRATLYVRRGVWENEATGFRFMREGSVGVFYWIDGPLGYALLGDLERNELQSLSEVVYEQLR